MAIRVDRRPGPKAVIFDLDETLIDSRRAWEYALEQAVLAVTGQRIDPRPLVEEYRGRDWREAVAIVVNGPVERERAAALSASMFGRSALKRLLVHEGVGMALDVLRGDATEVGAISRFPHQLALLQAQSTGLDRFLAVLSATPGDARFDVAERLAGCLRFLEYPASDCAFVSGEVTALEMAASIGFLAFEAAWAATGATGFPAIIHPGGLRDLLASRREEAPPRGV
ncbi:MAG: hypothetical protein HY875_06495 [Chloroflexi bacterium]|nr:hypothetical protein [Chloroflexota bacterium]